MAEMKIDHEHISILELFGKETLENLQQIISNVTGLGVITSDYKGTPLTEMTSFCPFCQCIRKRSEQLLICNLSDAFGIAQSAVKQKACIYQCPCGLMEMAIPIIIDSQFLGGFLAGQVKCSDVPKEIIRFDQLIRDIEFDEKEQKLYDDIPEITYEKFEYIAELVFQIINLLAEKTMAQMKSNSETSVENTVLKAEIHKLDYENVLLKQEIKRIKMQTKPFLLHHMINNLANIAIMENANETNKMILSYHTYIQQIYESKSEITTLNNELESLEYYFQLFTYGKKEDVSLKFNIKKEYMMQRIPAYLLVPIVEKILFPFTDGVYRKMDIEISAWSEETLFCLKIKSIHYPSGNKPLSDVNNLKDGLTHIQETSEMIQEKLELYFGTSYEMKEYDYSDHESECILKYPMYFKWNPPI